MTGRRNRGTRPLDGATAIVTGSAGGIGQSIAQRLAQDGANVVGIDLADQSATEELVAGEGARWLGLNIDTTDAEAVATGVDRAIGEFGDIAILVNNAAIDDPVSFDELDLETWHRVIAVDLNAPFIMCKAVVPSMRRRNSGRIINVASGSVVNPMTKFIAYRAGKSGLIGLTRALSTELGSDGICVNAVSPGVTLTTMARESLSPSFIEQSKQKQGIPRSGEPEDVAGVVAFLAGSEAAFVTGQTIMVNGGAAFL